MTDESKTQRIDAAGFAAFAVWYAPDKHDKSAAESWSTLPEDAKAKWIKTGEAVVAAALHPTSAPVAGMAEIEDLLRSIVNEEDEEIREHAGAALLDAIRTALARDAGTDAKQPCEVDASVIGRHFRDLAAIHPDKAQQARKLPSHQGWFVGQVMKLTEGKANPATVKDIVAVLLDYTTPPRPSPTAPSRE